ncbi:MAG: hypothetical protein NC115_12140 [Bacteroidales bacterium]|nr:hypothetical protein [Bacteroidales bacterium]
MATTEEIITEVRVETDSTTVKDLRDNIKALKAELEQATVGTEEFTAKQQKLDEANRTLKQAMNGSTASLKDMQDASAGVGKSYDALVNKMADLRKEWRATTDETKRADLGKQINEINNQLKALDASRGVFSRNVGDYANQMAKGFQATAGAAGSVINPVKNVTAGFQAMSATPVIAILGLVVNVLDKLIKSLKSNEETMNAFRRATAPLNAVMTVFTRGIQSAAEQLVKLVEWTMKAATVVGRFLGWISDEDMALMEEHKAITEQEIELTKKQRETELKNAESAEKVSELKAKAAQKDKYTAQERLNFLQAAADEEKAISDRNLELAQEEYDVLKRKADLAGNSAEENDALNRALIKLTQTRTEHNNKLRELNAQMSEANNQIVTATNAIIKQKKELEGLDNILKSIDDDLKSLDFGPLPEDDLDLSAYEDKWKQRAGIQLAGIDRELNNKRKLNAAMITDAEELADEEYRITVEAQQKKMAVLQEALSKTTDPAAHLELQQQIADLEVDIEVTKYARIKALRDKNSKEETSALQEWFQKAVEYSAKYVEIANATADLLSAVADGMEVTNKKEFERQKKLQIASATINMITGAVGAFMQASASYSPPWGQILGAITAATVVATGMTQINKLKAQTYDSPNASSAPVAVTPPQIDTSMPVVRTITSASEEDRLNQMASPVRAYIVDSELQAKQTERDRIQGETTF